MKAPCSVRWKPRAAMARRRRLPRTAADAVIAAVTRRRSATPAPEPVAATTSAVAALARAAVGATGRTLDSADEIVPTRGSTGFAATLARAAVNEPALPEQIFAPFAEAIVAPGRRRAGQPRPLPDRSAARGASRKRGAGRAAAAAADRCRRRRAAGQPPANRRWPMPLSKPRRPPPWLRLRC